MSDVTVTVDDKGMEAVIKVFGQDFAKLAKEALTEAFVLGGVQMAIWDATPMSDRARVAQDVGLDVDLRQGKGSIKTRKWRGQVTPKQAERIDQSGQRRLASSILPNPFSESLDPLGFKQVAGGAEFRIQSSVPYAGYVHEAEKPAKGEYWDHSKGGRGWSKPGTGQKFIEDNVDAHKMAEAMARCINAKVRA